MDTSFKQPRSGSFVSQIKDWLRKQGLSAIIIRSTDQYFNEYVPKHLSIRTQITGFDGSVGDAIITPAEAHLFVDGRYELQAHSQAPDFLVHVCKNNQSIESAWLEFLVSTLRRGEKLCIDSATLPLSLSQEILAKTAHLGIDLVPSAPTVFSLLQNREQSSKEKSLHLWLVEQNITQLTTSEKIDQLKGCLANLSIDGFLMVKLDDIAWALNLRSNHFPFQTTLPAIAMLFPSKILVGLSAGLEKAQKLALPDVVFVKESDFFQTLKGEIAAKPWVCGIDPTETSLKHQADLQACGIEIKNVSNPLLIKKAIKNEKELLHMRNAFKKADHVVHQTQNFVVESYQQGLTLSEGEVDDFVQKSFADSGAKELSFRPICASGKNGAVIHYGTPDRQNKIEPGSLFLLDTGGYYEGGYATDLTRTFLAGKISQQALPWQKQMFTLVLKASINGLSARIKRGTLGMQLDAIVRAPLWQAGLDFAHGTGHGVGINVHEFPPRIGPTSTTPLLEHQVFSIEPGLYFENLGGVRIENLATLVADPKNPQFLRILPLTFCPFDEKLIAYEMLSEHDKEFLAYYKQEWQSENSWPKLPPLKDIVF